MAGLPMRPVLISLPRAAPPLDVVPALIDAVVDRAAAAAARGGSTPGRDLSVTGAVVMTLSTSGSDSAPTPTVGLVTDACGLRSLSAPESTRDRRDGNPDEVRLRDSASPPSLLSKAPLSSLPPPVGTSGRPPLGRGAAPACSWCIRACMRVRACVRKCVRACVGVCERGCVLESAS